MANGRSIADVLFTAFLDDSGLSKQAEAAGDKAGMSLSKGLQSALRKGLLLGISGAAAIATKGLLELQNVQADFQAETGATADEAERAGKAINEMAGRNIQPMKEIGAALTKVHVDMGLTGKAAEDLTQQFLTFARVTKRDASEEVLAFDDILDNWGLTAKDAQGIMDKLIVSHQKFGGSIADNEVTLAKLAPAMKAANFQIDDAIALLGLFGAKGLNSERAAAAFSKALTKVKSPEELKQLIADIESTEDPFLRAQKAADLFGAKAGAQLANALGGANLDDYTISVDAAAGATQKAADVLDSTFSARVQLAIKGVTSKILEFGQSFGPAVTGLASLATLGGALGLDKAVAGAFRALAASSLVKAAAAKAGSVAATAYLAALITGDKIGAALVGAWNATGGKVVTAAASLGTASGLAFAAAVAAGILASAFIIGDAIVKALGYDPAKQKGQAKKVGELLGVDIVIGSQSAMYHEAQRKAGITYNVGRYIGKQVAKGAQDAVAETPIGVGLRADDLDITKQVAAAKERNRKAVADMAGSLATELASGGKNLQQVSAGLAKALPDAIANNAAEVRHQAVLSMVQFAAGLRDKRAQIKAAVEQIGTDMEDALSARQERLYLQGVLAGKEITNGLKSTDPIVKAQAQGTVGLITGRLTELGVDATKLGGQAGKNVASALAGTKGIVQTAAGTSVSGAKTVYSDAERLAKIYGYNTGKAYADGLRKTVGLVNDAANYVARGATGALKASSPPGPQSPLHKIDVWGERTMQAYADGIRNGIAAVRGSAMAAAGAVASGLAGAPAYSLAGAVSVPGGAMPLPHARSLSTDPTAARPVQQNNVTVQGLVKARDPFEIASAMERFQRTGVLAWPEHEK